MNYGLLSTHTGASAATPSLTDAVLRLIWREHRISRAEIARKLGLSRSTVTEIVRTLFKRELVAEAGRGESSGGRRPVMLEFQYDARCILGVDIGATHVAVAVTNLKGQLHIWKEASHEVRKDKEGTRALIVRMCDESLAESGHGAERLLSISIAVPSPVDPAHPEWLSEVVIPDWHGRSDLDRLHERYGVPVYVDNDANLGAMGEHWWGAGNGVNDFVFIKLGRGSGAGHILGGALYRGSAGVAGEIGHMPIDAYGKRCACGLNGCLGTFIGSRALKARARALLEEDANSILAHYSLNTAVIAKAALAGDSVGVQVVREAADHLGTALVGYINLMNPKMIILGGSLAEAGDLLLDPIREKVQRSALVRSVPDVEIRTSELGRHAVAVGAATLALDAAFSAPSLLRRASKPGVMDSYSKLPT